MAKLNLLLLLVLIVCALGLVTSQHKARKLFTELEREQERARSLEIEFGQLRIESRADGVCYVALPSGQTEAAFKLTSIATDEDENRTFEDVALHVLANDGGEAIVGPDGHLYVSTGDGSGPNPPDGLTTGQDVSDLLGAILRIDVVPFSLRMTFLFSELAAYLSRR